MQQSVVVQVVDAQTVAVLLAVYPEEHVKAPPLVPPVPQVGLPERLTVRRAAQG